MATYGLADRGQLAKEANKALDQDLAPDEKVMAIVRGEFSSAIIGTDRRVFVFKKGILSGSLMAQKVVSWEYRNVSGIQIETGVLGGTVSIQAAGATVGDAKTWTTFPGNSATSKAGNAITLRREHFEQARAGVARLRTLLAASQRPPVDATASDPIEQLRRLAELRDAGVISVEEFEAKKAEFLARM